MGKLITKQTTVLNVLRDEKGNTIITPEQQKFIDNFDSRSITEECPACDGDGVCGGDYCDVCWGKGKFTYHTELKIVPLSKDQMLQLELGNLKGDSIEKFKKDNPEQVVFTGTISEWKQIPSDINAISVDSKGKICYYSDVSGIYSLYDDEHTKGSKHKGGQYWYYGTSIEGLDITDKYKDLKILIKSSHTSIFYRPKIKRIVLDFKKPFDWSIFPKAVDKLFIAFGDMNITNQTISIVAGSKEIYLRDDNVIWGHGGRNHVDQSFDIDLCREWINDGTDAYPVRKEDLKKIGHNEMNIELKNIPYKTVVYELPKDRSVPVPVSKLKLAFVDECKNINKKTRPVKDHLTLAQYQLVHKDGIKREVELWLLGNVRIEGDYEILDSKKYGIIINATGDVRVQSDKDKEIKYKFGTVKGVFTLLGDNYDSLKNIPDECKELVISHSSKLTAISIPKVKINNGILRLNFMKSIKKIDKLDDSVKSIRYAYLENVDGIDFHDSCSKLEVKQEYIR